MELQTTSVTAAQQLDQVIRQTITAFNGQQKQITAYFDKYDEAVYQQQVAPGRNRAIYLLGHLTASHDSLLPMFGLGERKYPELDDVFLKNPDRTFPVIPGLQELKAMWTDVSAALDQGFSGMTSGDWLDRHTRVSPEDFAKEPHRNKLNVLMGRGIHEGYHLGQLNLLTTV